MNARRRWASRMMVDGDAGLATVWAAGAVVVLVSLLVFGLMLAGAIVARHRAEAAADLAALAAAGHAVDGEPVACAYGARVADRMNARLLDCRVADADAFVEVEAAPPALPRVWGQARGRARAGPVPSWAPP
jgi:secretion/DNA translocation related TadE-like protein